MKTLITTPVNNLQDPSCLTRNESAAISIDYTSVGETLPGGSSLASVWTVDCSILNSEGVIIFSESNTISLFNSALHSVVLDSVGEYVITTIYKDSVFDLMISEYDTFNVCDFISLTETGCNAYTYTNLSTHLTAQVHYEDPFGIIPAQDPVAVLPQTSVIISFPVVKPSGERYVGMFSVVTTYTLGAATQETKLASNFCVIEDCISTYILDIICGDIDRCNPCPDDVDLNRMLLLSYSYFMMLNKEFSLNVFYTALSATKLSQIQNINNVMSKLLKFCERKTCLSESVMNSSQWGIFTIDPNCTDCLPISSYISTCSTCR